MLQGCLILLTYMHSCTHLKEAEKLMVTSKNCQKQITKKFAIYFVVAVVVVAIVVDFNYPGPSIGVVYPLPFLIAESK